MKNLSILLSFLSLLFIIPFHSALAAEAAEFDEDFILNNFFLLPTPVIPEVSGCNLDQTDEACCGGPNGAGLADRLCGNRGWETCSANPCVIVENSRCDGGYGWVCECHFTCVRYEN